MLKMKGKINAIIAIETIIVMTLYYFIFVGMTAITYAIDIIKTNNENIEFTAYFINQNGEKVDSIEDNIDKENEYLYVDVSVKNEGFFNGSIELKDNNFSIKNEKLSDQITDISNNVVTLKQINAGTTSTIKLAIEPKNDDMIELQNLDMKTKVNLIGQYVNSKNVEKDDYVDIKGLVEVEVKWLSSENTEAILESKVLTNKIYEINGENKRIVQLLINSKITNNNYPVKNTKLTLNVPENVEEVKVHARETAATNKSIEFKEENYTYNKEQNKLDIELGNIDTKNISWQKNAEDKIIVTYVLNEKEDITNQIISIEDKITTYDEKDLKTNGTITIDEEKDGVITSELTFSENEIYKGKIYTNEEREYTETTKINIDYLNTTNSIVLNNNKTKFIENENEKNANTIFKQTKIDKAEFLKIFGEDGFITIEDQDGTIIANINKDSEVNENGKIVINYQNISLNNIEIKTSNPINLGTLNIVNQKSILNNEYTREEIERFTDLKEEYFVNNLKYENKVLLKETTSSAEISIDTKKISTLADKQTITINAILKANSQANDLYKNPEVKLKFPKELTVITASYSALYKNGLEVLESNLTQNENGEAIVDIKFAGEQNNYDVSGGTTICIKADVKASKLTPSQTTSIDMTYTNENKNIQNTISKEIEIESQDGLMLYNKLKDFNNEEVLETIDTKTVTGNLQIKAEEKEATLQTALINNYNEELLNVTLIGKIPSKNEQNTFNSQINSINTNIENAKIYYTSKQNANIDDESWQENNENAVAYKIVIDKINPMQVIAISTKIKIPENLKFNENGLLSTDVYYYKNETEIKNSSSMELKTVDGVKNNEEKEEKEQKNEDTQTSNTAGTTNGNTLSETATTKDGVEVKITAEIGEQTLVDGQNIKEGETIRYKIKITNNSGKDLNNLQLTAKQKNGYVWGVVKKITKKYTDATHYTEVESYWDEVTDQNNVTFEKVSIKNGQSQELSYKAQTYLLNNEKIDGKETFGEIQIKSQDETINNTVKTIKNQIQSAKIQIYMLNNTSRSVTWQEGRGFSASLYVKNLENTDQENIEAKLRFSKEFSKSINYDQFIFSAYISSLTDSDPSNLEFEKIEKNENEEIIVTFKIKKLLANETNRITMSLSPMNLSKDMECNVYSEVAINSNEVYKTSFDVDVKKTNTTFAMSVSAEKDGKTITKTDKLNNGDIINFIINVKNTHTEDIRVDISYEMDETLSVTKAYLNDKDVTSSYEGNTLNLREIDLKPGENAKVVAQAKVDGNEVESFTNKLFVYDHFSVSSKTEDTTYSVNSIDEGDKENSNNGNSNNGNSNNGNSNNGNSNNGNSDNGNSNNGNSNNGNANTGEDKGEYVVSGIVWLDENEDGKKDVSEEKVEQIEVGAIDTKTNKIVAKTQTDKQGNYSLDLEEGNYIVIFYYDTETYKATTYKAKGISEEENSSAIEKEVSINGITKTVGATDTLSLNKNIANVNLGITKRGHFNLKIDKSVSKITVKNNEGTKNYEQKDGTTLAKAEIRSKYLKGSLIVIEYKIKITNNGDVAGYAKNIEDTLPQTLTFNSSMNKEWYKSGSNVYTTSLANTLINPRRNKRNNIITN